MKRNLLAEVPALPGHLRALLPGNLGGAADLAEPRTGRAQTRVPRATGPVDRLALAEVRGNITVTADTITVWFTLRKQVWPFRSDGSREAVISAAASRYAALAGHALHVRRVSVPFPVGTWARDLHRNSRPLPDSVPHVDPATAALVDQWASGLPLAHPGGRHETLERAIPYPPTWRQHLAAAAAHLQRSDYSDTRTHLGVTFDRPRSLGRPRPVDTCLAVLAEDIARVTETVAAPGLAARGATTDELLWLIYRSTRIGLAPPTFRPGDLTADDIAEFTEGIELRRGPHDATTQITDRYTGQSVHVAVLTMGRMEPLVIPQHHEPWAYLSAQLSFPVEWSSRVWVLNPAAARADMHKQLLKIRSQQRDYAEHDLDVPMELDRLAQRGLEVEDQLDTAQAADATRVHGFHRAAVYGATADEAMARARELALVYDNALKATLVQPKGQYHLMREFIPGQAAVNIGYVRRQPVKMFAAGVPQASAVVGDGRGDYIGHTTTGGTLPVLWDAHYAMEVRERSGLSVFVAEPGGGKSTLMATLGYLNARRGVNVTLLDPSGPLARLAQMPELRAHTRVIDLVGSQSGTLAPYAMIPTPRRGDYPAGPAGDRKHGEEVELARAERFALVLDILQMLLPATIVEDNATIVALHDAVRQVPREETSTLDQVIEQLYQLGRDDGNKVAVTIGHLLDDMVHLPLAKLFFGSPPPGTVDTDAALTVITMAGLRLPDPGSDRRYWSLSERFAVPMLHLANMLAVRRCYGGPMTARKLCGLDEAHFMNRWESGKAFLIRLARDSRKWNLAALVASQNPSDILALGVQNLVSTVFVGRVADDQQVAADALRLLGVHLVGAGYESTLAELSQVADTDQVTRLGYREFVMRDVDNRIQKIRIDVSWIAGLLATIDTTPGLLSGRDDQGDPQ